MIVDWLSREGWIVVNWWLIVTVAGLTAIPLLFRLCGGLPDRGFTLARPAGILLIGFVFWLLAILGFVDNSVGSILLAWLVVLVISCGVFFTNQMPFQWRLWWEENRSIVIVTETLFVVLLVGWAIFRAYQNDLTTTEKPMDLAFMSGIQRSVNFPPNDPWLSDYAISYYYFGYLMAATMSQVAGVWSTIGYNMHIALLFALTGTTTFGVTYNLVRSRAFQIDTVTNLQSILKGPSQKTAAMVGALAVILMIWISNLQPIVVELPFRAHAVSEEYLSFWDTKERDTYSGRTEALNILDPEQSGSNLWWWFNASRVITERDLDGVRYNEVIDEFPMFSFLLADSHPHVMALPFVLLAIGIALNTLLSSNKPDRTQIIFYGIFAGGLIFLNTWDAPIYVALIVCADGCRRLVQSGRGRLGMSDWLELLKLAAMLVVIMLVAYLPFLVGFRSQLSGILVNFFYPTRFQQLFLMFGPFIALLAVFLGVEIWRGRRDGRMNWTLGFEVAGVVLIVLLVGVAILALGGRLDGRTWASVTQFVDQNGGWNNVVTEIVARRIDPLRLLTLIVLLAGIGIIVARLFPRRQPDDYGDSENITLSTIYPASTGFALLLIGAGLSLILIPEFLYLRDNFGTRMNTVFKFYYQAWVVFSVASAYGAYTLLADLRLPRPAIPLRYVYGIIVIIIIGIGSVYPVLGIYSRMFIESNRAGQDAEIPLTLDGGIRYVQSDDYQVIMCLQDLVAREEGIVVAEAERDDYRSYYGRVGSLTGVPVLISWVGHESQWRGTGYGAAVGSRRQDLRQLYTDLRYDAVQPIIERYGIDYILYGSSERGDYGIAGEEKFMENLEVVCESGISRIYRITPQSGDIKPVD